MHRAFYLSQRVGNHSETRILFRWEATNMTLRIPRLALLALLVAPLALACANPPAHDPLLGPRLSASENAPMGGQALAERRNEMQSASRDLQQFHTTLIGLRQRKDTKSYRVFKRFVGAYLADHLDPILSRAWPSEHPELAGLDANLRVMKAELLIQMGRRAAAQNVIDDLDRRFEGRDRILVDYPVGAQTTLKTAIQILRERKWRIGRLKV